MESHNREYFFLVYLSGEKICQIKGDIEFDVQ